MVVFVALPEQHKHTHTHTHKIYKYSHTGLSRLHFAVFVIPGHNNQKKNWEKIYSLVTTTTYK